MTAQPGHGRRQTGQQFGAFPFEREIMDLWDEGLSEEAIVERSGRSLRTVRWVISYLGGADPRPREIARARSGSAALLAAIRRHHPELRP